MADTPTGSMFDYDARPATPQVAIVDNRASPLGYHLRDFLSRNGISSLGFQRLSGAAMTLTAAREIVRGVAASR
jgi:hypothetical protein